MITYVRPNKKKKDGSRKKKDGVVGRDRREKKDGRRTPDNTSYNTS